MRFPGFEGEWKQITLGECSISLDYGMNTAAKTFDGINKYIRITDIDENSSRYKSENPVSPSGNIDEKYLVGENDILFARTGASTGKSYLYHQDDGKLYFAGFLIRAKIKNEHNSMFIFSQTQTEKYNKWVQLMSMRSGQPGINSQEYSSFKFFLPSIKQEQDKIASFLSLIDERIATQNKIIRELDVLKAALSKKIFSQELRFQDNNGSDYPTWKTKRLKEVCEINPKTESIPYTFYYIDLESVANGRLLKEVRILKEEAPSRAQRVLAKNDVLFQMVRPYQKNNYFFDKEGEYVASTGYAQIRTKQNSQFIYQHLQNQRFVDKVIERCTGTSYPAINSNDLGNIEIDYPSLPEQAKIADCLSSIDSKIHIETQRFQKLEEQKKFLLQQMFV